MRRSRGIVVAVALIVVVAASGAVGLIASRRAENKASAIHADDRLHLQETLSGLTGQYLRFALVEALDATAQPWNLAPGDKADLARLESFVTNGKLINHGAALADLSGAPLTMWSRPGGLPPATDPGFEDIRSMLLAGQPGVSRLMDVPGAHVVALGLPIMGPLGPRGVLVAFFNAETSPLQTYNRGLRYGATGMGFVLDREGRVVTARDPKLIGSFPDEPVRAALVPRKAEFVRYRKGGDSGTDMVATVSPIDIGGWGAATTQTAAEFFGPIEQSQDRVAYAVISTLALAAVAMIVLGLRVAEARRRAEDRLRSLLQHSFDVVTVLDGDGRVIEDTPSLQTVLGFDRAERVGMQASEYIHPDDLPEARETFQQALEAPGSSFRSHMRIRHKSGGWRWFEVIVTNLMQDPNVRGLVVNQRDVSERRIYEEQIAEQAFRDNLTGLANRGLFRNRLDVALSRARRAGSGVGLVYIDLDGFKAVNDTFGHGAGDELLRAVGDRLRLHVREVDTLARIGGDEFVVLVEDVADKNEVRAVAERAGAAFIVPMQVNGHSLKTRASIGVAWSPGGEVEADTLMRMADMDMYREKGRSRSA